MLCLPGMESLTETGSAEPATHLETRAGLCVVAHVHRAYLGIGREAVAMYLDAALIDLREPFEQGRELVISIEHGKSRSG